MTARPVDGEASHGTGSTRHADEWLLVTLLIDSSPRHHGRPGGLVPGCTDRTEVLCLEDACGWGTSDSIKLHCLF